MNQISGNEIRKILSEANTIAVVGASVNPYRASHSIMKYLLQRGYRVIPVNPHYREVLGEKCYPTLLDVPEPVDIVDIFRRGDEVTPLIDDAIAKGVRTVWMQVGVTNERAARTAEEAGLRVIVDRCILTDCQSLFPA